MSINRFPLIALIIALTVLIWSALSPKDYLTWLLEVTPGVIGIVVMIATYKKFRLTDFLYAVILIHCCILFVGGKYTYAENPLFEYLKHFAGWQRNNYDKLGHFFQGFAPALVARELMMRRKIVSSRKWAAFFAISVVMLISSGYELFEWGSAVVLGQSADDFLGTQGDQWDTQSDMLFALIGALSALVFFSRIHDKFLLRTGKK